MILAFTMFAVWRLTDFCCRLMCWRTSQQNKEWLLRLYSCESQPCFFFVVFFFKATINQVWHFQFFTSSEILLASSLLKLFFPFAALWHFSVVSAQRGINSAPQGSPRMKYHCLLLHAQTGGFGLVLWPALSPWIHETGWCHGISSATRSMGCFSFCQQAPEFLRGKAL